MRWPAITGRPHGDSPLWDLCKAEIPFYSMIHAGFLPLQCAAQVENPLDSFENHFPALQTSEVCQRSLGNFEAPDKQGSSGIDYPSLGTTFGRKWQDAFGSGCK